MSDRLKELRERSSKRKQLLAQAFGVESPDALKTVLKTNDSSVEERDSRVKLSSNGDGMPTKKTVDAVAVDDAQLQTAGTGSDKQKTDLDKEDEEVDEIYRDSSTFLKGTQSHNPHNDYCQNFVDTGERPQNFIRDVGLANRFEEYPKLRELIRLKDELIATTNTPPMYLQCNIETFDLHDLGNKFDVILIEPPLIEYQRTKGVVFDKYWSWDEIERLDIPTVAAQRSFLWMWCGNAEGLERGRMCLKQWGFRRCEDICWIKTNISNPGHNKNLEPNAIFQRTKEHCLMGIKGTVKRSTDGDFIHANVDIDLIIEEDPPYGCKDKPVEIFHIIEHFCLGRRRLHIFGRDSTIRPGWLTIGPELTSSNFDPEVYSNFFKDSHVMVCDEEIERLRPKSPTSKSKQGDRGDRGGKGARGRGGMDRGGRGDNRNMGGNRGGLLNRSPGGRGGRGMARNMGRGGNFKPRNLHHRNENMMR